MRQTGGQCHCALFSEGHILGAAVTHKPIAHQHGERGTVAGCDVHARGQYLHFLLLVLPLHQVMLSLHQCLSHRQSDPELETVAACYVLLSCLVWIRNTKHNQNQYRYHRDETGC